MLLDGRRCCRRCRCVALPVLPLSSRSLSRVPAQHGCLGHVRSFCRGLPIEFLALWRRNLTFLDVLGLLGSKERSHGVLLLFFSRLIVDPASLFPLYLVLLEVWPIVFLVWLPWLGRVKLLGGKGVARSRFGENWCHLSSACWPGVHVGCPLPLFGVKCSPLCFSMLSVAAVNIVLPHCVHEVWS